MISTDSAATTVVEWIKRDFKVINLGIFFDESLRQHPDSTAIIDLTDDEPRSYTYAELEVEVCRAAQALRAVGLRKNDRCIVSIPNGVTFLSVFLGALRLGIVPVPINFRLGADTLQSIVRDARCRAVVGSPKHTATCCDIADKLDIPIRFSTDDARPAGTTIARSPPGSRTTASSSRWRSTISPSSPTPPVRPVRPRASR